MKHLEPKPYRPSVKPIDMIGFVPGDPTTNTASPFINAFLEIFYATEAEERQIAEAMDLSLPDFTGAFRVETGMRFTDFRDYWTAYKLNVAVALHPELSGDALAQYVGFGHRSALWQFYNSERYKKIAEELNLVRFPKPMR